MTTTAVARTGDAVDAVMARLERAWRRSDTLFATIREDALGERGIPLRHPPIFYLGHLPAFAWNQLGRGVLGRAPLHAEWDELFERGIDPRCDTGGGAAGASAVPAWPRPDEVRAYRDRARDAVRAAARALPDRAEHDELARDATILHVVLEHELMHHETLLYIVQRLDRERLDPAGWDDARPGPDDAREPPPAREVAIPAGRATIGRPRGERAFGWDNEFPALTVDVGAFAIDSRPVTLGELAAFVADGGYADARLWSDAERRWLGDRRAPVDWHLEGDEVRVRTLFDEVPLAAVASWPAYVSQVEARAYLRAAGKRLPSEAELHRAAYGSPDDAGSAYGSPDDKDDPGTASGNRDDPGIAREYPWGQAAPGEAHGGFDFHPRRPLPVGSRPAGRSAFGVDELVGNGWEWTSTRFGGLPGFERTIRTYPGYSADFFDAQHAVVFGAAWPTDRALLRRGFRNWYQTHYPYAYTAFRGVRA